MIKISLGKLTINEIRNTSGVFSGRNHHIRWNNTTSVNEGFGRVAGDQNVIKDSASGVMDRDLYKELKKQKRT